MEPSALAMPKVRKLASELSLAMPSKRTGASPLQQAFCARDNVRVDPTASAFAHYDCERQGIQRGWEDIYAPTLPCQYLDITDVPPGHYMLEVEVNPDGALTELDYSNNRAAVPVVLP